MKNIHIIMQPNFSTLYRAELKLCSLKWALWFGPSQAVQVVKNLAANTGDLRGVSLIPGSERSPGGGHGNPLQYSCRENPMDRGAWWATAHKITKSWTGLKQLSMHAIIH